TQTMPPTTDYTHQSQSQYQTPPAQSHARTHAHTSELEPTSHPQFLKTIHADTNQSTTHSTSQTGKYDAHAHPPSTYAPVLTPSHLPHDQSTSHQNVQNQSNSTNSPQRP